MTSPTPLRSRSDIFLKRSGDAGTVKTGPRRADHLRVDRDRTPAAPWADRWRARPAAALAVRAAAVVLPLAAGLGVARAGVVLLAGVPGGRVLGLLAGVAVALAGRRSARPAVALATLLALDLPFPGPAPSRARLALTDPRAAVRRARTSRTADAAANAAAVGGLIAVAGAHDRRHRHRLRRVLAVARVLGGTLGLDRADADRLAWAALLADVGKLGVDDDILRRSSSPTAAQWEVLRRHPDDGALLAAPLLPLLGDWGAAVRHHHERWDGTGYPDALAGPAIPYPARVVALADAYESMTQARPYRAPLATRAARAEVVRCAGTQFDPEVVAAFLRAPLVPLLRATGAVTLLAGLPLLGSLARVGSQGVVAAAGAPAVAVAASTAVVLGGVAATGGLGPADATGPGTAAAPPATQSPDPDGSTPGPDGPTTTRAAPTGSAPATRTTVAATSSGTPSGRHTATTPADRPTTTRPTARPTDRPTTDRPTTDRPTDRPTTTRTVPATTTTHPTSRTTTRTTTPTSSTSRTTTRSPGPTMTSTTPTTGPTPGSPDASGSPYAVPAQRPVDDHPTTMLPAMRVPAEGPVAPRIRIHPPGATDLPAAGFSWPVVLGLDYEARLDDGRWLACEEQWCALFIDLPRGPHRFYVRSVDPSSGARSEIARYDWTVS